MRGSADSTIDDKGRLKVPAVYRESIESTYGNEFFVTSLTGKDILVYPLPVWAAFESSFDGFTPGNDIVDLFFERYNTFGGEARMDSQGRLLIPQRLRESSKLTGEVMVLGQSNHLQVVDRVSHMERVMSTPLTPEQYAEFRRMSRRGKAEGA